jgi:uncharacterized Ntn-hydrolase superfamily protein
VTFSIVARGRDGESFGVAVASKFLAVGSAVPAAEAKVGALATQALANLGYRDDGLRLLRDGVGAADVARRLTEADEGRVHRQLGVVDGTGGSASFTGSECLAWAGGRHGDGYAVQGNILTGEDVVEAMERAWLTSDRGQPLARRLMAALAAGDRAGGDRRGRQSAAIFVVKPDAGYGGGSDVWVDLRVDDHPEPIPELLRLLDLHDLFFGAPDPEKLLPLDGDLLVEVAGLLRQVGQPSAPGDAPAADPVAVQDALAAWAGEVNLEERLREGRLDPLVLEVLRQRAAASEPGPVRPPG